MMGPLVWFADEEGLHFGETCFGGKVTGTMHPFCAKAVADQHNKQIQEAVAAEREACAKVADAVESTATHVIRQVAARTIGDGIRARGSLGPASKPDDVDYPADHFGDLG